MSGMDVLRERIARALDPEAWETRPPIEVSTASVPVAIFARRKGSRNKADAVIAALGLVERRVSELDPGDGTPHRMFMTPWERIGENG